MQRPYIEDIIRWKIKLHLRQLTDDRTVMAMNTLGKMGGSALLNYWMQILKRMCLAYRFVKLPLSRILLRRH